MRFSLNRLHRLQRPSFPTGGSYLKRKVESGACADEDRALRI